MTTDLAAELAARKASGVSMSKLCAVQVTCRHRWEVLAVYRLGNGRLAVEYRPPSQRNMPPTPEEIAAHGGEVQRTAPYYSQALVVCTPESLGVGRTIDGTPVNFEFYAASECCSVKVGTRFLAAQIRAADERHRKVRIVAPGA